MPDAEMMAPIRMNRGTAVKVKLTTEDHKVGATSPRASKPPPRMTMEARPTPIKEKATGTPISKKASKEANIARPIHTSVMHGLFVGQFAFLPGNEKQHDQQQPEHAYEKEEIGNP